MIVRLKKFDTEKRTGLGKERGRGRAKMIVEGKGQMVRKVQRISTTDSNRGQTLSAMIV